MIYEEFKTMLKAAYGDVEISAELKAASVNGPAIVLEPIDLSTPDAEPS